MKKIKITLLFWLTVSVWLFTSCLMDINSPVYDGGEEGSVSVKVMIDMARQAFPQTYSASLDDENSVCDIDVLAFKAVNPDAQHPSGWALDYRARGSSIQNTGQPDKKQFTVSLVKRNYAQHLVVLANAANEIDGLNSMKGDDRDALLEQLISNNQGKWPAENSNSFRPFPMWGEKKGVMVNENTPATIDDIKMMRAVARIDVQVASTAIGNFRIKEVLIYNSKNKGYIVPGESNITNMQAKFATAPSDPQIYETWNNGANNSLRYDIPSGATELLRSIYLYEAKAPQSGDASKATCLVIGGYYGNDSQPTYYRVDFTDVDKNYKDILRNHHYTVKIVQIDGPGYETPDAAFNGVAVNMTMQLINWSDPDIYYIVYDARNYLGVSPVEFFFPESASSGNSVNVATDVASGWIAEEVSTSETRGEGESVDWITVHNGQNGAGKSSFTFDIEEYSSGSTRIAYIHIRAGRLTCTVKITQENHPSSSNCGTGGVALLQQIGNRSYLTHEYGTGTNKRCWMVQNSMEGTQFSGIAYGQDSFGNNLGNLYDGNWKIIYSGLRGETNGYYYTWEQASMENNACPSGWRLPYKAEIEALKGEVEPDMIANLYSPENATVSKWWIGMPGMDNGAFAGHYTNGYYKGWYSWGIAGYWWSNDPKGERYFFGDVGRLLYESNAPDNYWMSVRCVKIN